MPFCGECGFNMPAGVGFCGECGHKTSGPSSAAAAPSAAAPKSQPAAAPPSNSTTQEAAVFAQDAKLCGGCKRSLAGVIRLLTALDQEWHPECFVCSNCRNTFGDDDGKFFVKNGVPVCKNCSVADAPKCAGCFKPCTENFLKALNVSWHAECFVCETCRKVIGGSFIVRNDKPYCTSTCGDHAKAKPAQSAPASQPAATTRPAAQAAAPAAAAGGGGAGGAKKFCGECGSKMDANKSFCGECGFKMG